MPIKSNHLGKLLKEEPEKTCFILKNQQIIFTSESKGVKPMLDYHAIYGVSLEPLTVIDRVMGKGAIILAIFIGAKHVITPVISKFALDFSLSQKIDVEYDQVVPYIINRTKDGQCPIEKAVAEIDNICQGYQVIEKTLLELKGR